MCGGPQRTGIRPPSGLSEASKEAWREGVIPRITLPRYIASNAAKRTCGNEDVCCTTASANLHSIFSNCWQYANIMMPAIKIGGNMARRTSNPDATPLVDLAQNPSELRLAVKRKRPGKPSEPASSARVNSAPALPLEPTVPASISAADEAGSSPKPFKAATRVGLKKVTVGLNPNHHEELKVLAARRRCSVEELLREAVADLFAKHSIRL